MGSLTHKSTTRKLWLDRRPQQVGWCRWTNKRKAWFWRQKQVDRKHKRISTGSTALSPSCGQCPHCNWKKLCPIYHRLIEAHLGKLRFSQEVASTQTEIAISLIKWRPICLQAANANSRICRHLTTLRWHLPPSPGYQVVSMVGARLQVPVFATSRNQCVVDRHAYSTIKLGKYFRCQRPAQHGCPF